MGDDYVSALYCLGPPVDPTLRNFPYDSHCWHIMRESYHMLLTRQALILTLIVMVIYDKALPGSIRYLFPLLIILLFYAGVDLSGFCNGSMPVESVIASVTLVISSILIVHLSRIDDQRHFYITEANVATEETENIEKHTS